MILDILKIELQCSAPLLRHPQLPRPLVASGTGTATVPRSSSSGMASSSLKGEAVIMRDALRARIGVPEPCRPTG